VLAVRAEVAVRAVVFPLPVRAPLFSSHHAQSAASPPPPRAYICLRAMRRDDLSSPARVVAFEATFRFVREFRHVRF
jgi:hypothetical protein